VIEDTSPAGLTLGGVVVTDGATLDFKVRGTSSDAYFSIQAGSTLSFHPLQSYDFVVTNTTDQHISFVFQTTSFRGYGIGSGEVHFGQLTNPTPGQYGVTQDGSITIGGDVIIMDAIIMVMDLLVNLFIDSAAGTNWGIQVRDAAILRVYSGGSIMATNPSGDTLMIESGATLDLVGTDSASAALRHRSLFLGVPIIIAQGGFITATSNYHLYITLVNGMALNNSGSINNVPAASWHVYNAAGNELITNHATGIITFECNGTQTSSSYQVNTINYGKISFAQYDYNSSIYIGGLSIQNGNEWINISLVNRGRVIITGNVQFIAGSEFSMIDGKLVLNWPNYYVDGLTQYLHPQLIVDNLSLAPFSLVITLHRDLPWHTMFGGAVNNHIELLIRNQLRAYDNAVTGSVIDWFSTSGPLFVDTGVSEDTTVAQPNSAIVVGSNPIEIQWFTERSSSSSSTCGGYIGCAQCSGHAYDQGCVWCSASDSCTLRSAADLAPLQCALRGTNSNLTDCLACPVGTYADSTGCSSCGNLKTTPGAGSISIDNCTCILGYFADTSNACGTCLQGSYRDSLELATCTQCDTSSTTVAEGSTSHLQCLCKPGYSYTGGRCRACKENTYKSSLNNSQCDPCLDGSITLNKTSTHPSDCLCSSGYEVNHNQWSSSNISKPVVCEQCDIGYFKSDPTNDIDCEPCPQDTSTLATGAINRAECLCKPGMYLASSCSQCPPNTFKSKVSNSQCQSCGGNSSATHPSRTSCICVDNYQWNTNTEQCIPCPLGQISKFGGQCICTQGSYMNSSSQCISCGIGRSTSGDGATSVSQCQCDAGYELINSTTCEMCKVGYNKPFVSNDPCGLCGTGYWTATLGSLGCKCDRDYYLDTGAKQCKSCPAGQYNPIVSFDVNCTICPIDTYRPFGASSSSNGTFIYGCIACAMNSTTKGIKGSISESACIPPVIEPHVVKVDDVIEAGTGITPHRPILFIILSSFMFLSMSLHVNRWRYRNSGKCNSNNNNSNISSISSCNIS
jgi:hypothetical protein